MVNCSDCGEKEHNSIYKESMYCDICVECKVLEYYGLQQKSISNEKMLEASKSIRFYEKQWINEARKHGIDTINRDVVKAIIKDVQQNGIKNVKEILKRGIENEKANS